MLENFSIQFNPFYLYTNIVSDILEHPVYIHVCMYVCILKMCKYTLIFIYYCKNVTLNNMNIYYESYICFSHLQAPNNTLYIL